MPISTASLSIDGNQTVGNLLTGKSGLCVPPSQRSYRWKREHVEALYRDIGDNLLSDEYFLGSVVVVSPENTRKTFVFDGQQRLATTMILIGAIRDQFLNFKVEKTAGNIERDSLFSEDRETNEETPHFILNLEDQSFFYNRVVCRASDPRRKALKARTKTPEHEKTILPESHKRIDAAARLAAAHVKQNIVASLPEAEALKRLHQWLNFIRDSLRVIWILVADERTAFTIFETMNDRGLRLSAADLLKNRLYAVADKRQAEVIQKWQSMTGVLETIEGQEEGALEYIRCFWVANNGHTRTKELYDKMKAKAQNAAQAVALAAQLEESAQDYAAILLASHEKWANRGANIRAKIETIKLLGVTQLRPVLLAALHKFSNKEFDSLLETCVSLSVRSLLGGVPSGSIEDYYAGAALKITEGKITKATEVKHEMAKVIPDSKKFREAVATANVGKASIARYYLGALQRCKDNEQFPQYVVNTGDEITLEHILPVKPEKDDWDHFSEIEKRQYLNRLGSLALITEPVNSSIGNVAYKVKEPALKESKYSLTSMTARLSLWGKYEIEERQKELADLAVKTWPL